MKNLLILLIVLPSILFIGCSRSYQDDDSSAEEFTLGNVQKRISKGMTQREVAEALGSPNIVTKDKDGGEAWIYDKMGSEVRYSSQSGGFWLIIAGTSETSGRVKTTQKTLTVVIRFNEDAKVETVTYHASKY